MLNKNLETIWEKRIKDYKESELPMNRWCKDNDIRVHQLYYWLKKLKMKIQFNKKQIEINFQLHWKIKFPNISNSFLFTTNSTKFYNF